MANQTVTTALNYDAASISGLLNGETITINGGTVTVDADVRWNQQAAFLGNVTISSSLGGSLVVDGTKIWEIPFSASSGNVPTQNALGSNGVTGGTSGATGELTRVWATGSLDPATAGGAMPATGWIKLRSKTGTFQAGETITLPGGATITAVDAGKRSWIHVVGREATAISLPRLGSAPFTGDWYELGVTNGADGQTFQGPVADEIPALQMETSPGSGIYEWWLNAGRRWHGHNQPVVPNDNGISVTYNNIAPPSYADPIGFLAPGRRIRETATTGLHVAQSPIGGGQFLSGIYTLRTYIKKETRQYGFVAISDNSPLVNSYGVIIDFDAAGAVVATPTVGSPTGTSNTVIDAGGGWYRVDLTFTVNINNGVTGYVGPSNSAAPTLSSGRPSYAGSASEGMYYTELQIIAPTSIQYVNSTDERGKFFYANPQTGVITIAQRTGRIAGLKPASGCKIRIPNIICSNANLIAPTLNTAAIGFFRYTITTTSAGPVSIDKVTMNWLGSFSTPYSFSVQNSAMTSCIAVTCASPVTMSNIGCGGSRDDGTVTRIVASSCPSGGTITDCRVATFDFSRLPFQVSTSSGFTLTRCTAEIHGGQVGLTGRANQNGSGIIVTNCSNVTVTDCKIVGCNLSVTTSNSTRITNLTYAEKTLGSTASGDNGTAVSVLTSCVGTVIDGISLISGLTNVHPGLNIVDVRTNTSTTTIKNIGTPSAPFDCGTVAPTGQPIQLNGGTVFNTLIQRVYLQNTGAAPVLGVNNSQGMRLINVWGDATDAFTGLPINDTLAQGCRWSKDTTVNTAIYGTHWEDAFTGTNRGRITIYGNEPLPSTAGQCSTTLGALAGFTSAGNIALPNVGDKVTWTMPYYALGHTGIALFGYGASAADNWNVVGTNIAHFEYRYQIDPGTGTFSAFKWLMSLVRQASGGASGASTVTLVAAEQNALTRKPAIGDFIQTGSGRLPAGTTVTNVVGAVITTSSPFASTVAGNEAIYFWKDISAETISPTTGYKLRVELNTTTANSSNLFGQLRIPFDTNSTAQQTQYPEPGSLLTVDGLVAGSRVKVSRVDTGAFLAQAQAVGGTASFDVPYAGSVRVEARNASSPTAYRPWQSIVNISANSPTEITALQEPD
jgi:hypothetical protein